MYWLRRNSFILECSFVQEFLAWTRKLSWNLFSFSYKNTCAWARLEALGRWSSSLAASPQQLNSKVLWSTGSTQTIKSPPFTTGLDTVMLTVAVSNSPSISPKSMFLLRNWSLPQRQLLKWQRFWNSALKKSSDLAVGDLADHVF